MIRKPGPGHAAQPAALASLKRTLVNCLEDGGKVLLDFFGRITNPRRKENTSSIVCDADLAADASIVNRIRRAFPEDGIIAEESGFAPGDSGRIWVVDPLDGTSNFVAGLPWFGVQIGVLLEGKPVLAGMYLPLDQTLYYAESGRGAFRNGRPVRVTPEPRLNNVLCAFGFDPDRDARRRRAGSDLLFRVGGAVRNVRTTNSLYDFCYTVDGRLGGCVNLCTKIWDIVPVSLILPEAGGRFTDIAGKRIAFDLGAKTFGRSYEVLGASGRLHRSLVRAARQPA